MSSPILVLVGVGLLVGTALGVLAVLIVGIRKGDRGHLSIPPQSHSGAFARRILVGVRYPDDNSEEDDQ